MLTVGTCDTYLYRSRYGVLEKESIHRNPTASPSISLPRARLKVAGASGECAGILLRRNLCPIKKLEIRLTESR